MMKMRIAIIPVLTLALISCSGGGGGGGSSYSTPTAPVPQPPAAANTIAATDLLNFSPTDLTVTKGTAVTFTFQSVTHSIVFDAGAGVADTGPLYNTSVQRTFSTAGTFPFHCAIHSYMTGQITVQ